jgi:glucose/arabinose dehydrogenase
MKITRIIGIALWGAVVIVLAGAIIARGDVARLSVQAGTGATPQLPPPEAIVLPTVRIAKPVGWSEGAAPHPAAGLAVSAFATGLAHPRWLYVLPNGDVLVAETNSPGADTKLPGIRAALTRAVRRAVGAGAPSANRISLLRRRADGSVARFTFLQNLHSPFGMLLIGNDFYVANADSVVRYPYNFGETSITAPGQTLTMLAGDQATGHWTRNIVASPDGSRLYVSIGSSSNIAENGLPAEQGRADIWEIDRATGRHRVFASGLRNPVGMAFEPDTHILWTSVNERDRLGSDLVPDYMTSVRDGGFYGWPWSYFGQHVDARVTPPNPAMVARAIVPDYALGPHTASLGLAFSRQSQLLPARFADGAFIGQHGSWNRNPPSGYKVIFVPFNDGKPAGAPVDVLTGFLDADGHAHGRPVGVAIANDGALLVADDLGNCVWRVANPR